MKIHHIINDYNLSQGGAQRLVLDLHNGCLNSGLSSKLFGLSKDPNYYIKDSFSLKYISPYKIIVVYKLWKYFKNEVSSDDIVHVHLFPSIFYVAFLRFFNLIPKCKFILTEHNTLNKRRSFFAGRLIDYFIYKSYDKIVTISSGVNFALNAWMPKISNKLEIITNGAHIPFENFYDRKSKKRPVILSVGRLHVQKNYKTALNALSKINNLEFEYWIAGSGELGDDLKLHVENFKLQKKVRFLGYVKDIPSLLKRADIFLIPSKWEGFGLAAVEAMNAGLPCIVSDVPGLGDLINKDGEEGFKVSSKDSDAISKRLKLLIEDRTLRKKMGKKAFAHSFNFSIKKMIENYINLYKKI